MNTIEMIDRLGKVAKALNKALKEQTEGLGAADRKQFLKLSRDTVTGVVDDYDSAPQ